jgi:hypothetical protein
MLGAILSFGNFSGFAAVSAGRVAMTLGMLATAGSTVALTFSGAIFTDSQVLASNSFSAGTVEISTNPTSAAISLANMAPGNVVTGPLTVSNDGSLQHPRKHARRSAGNDHQIRRHHVRQLRLRNRWHRHLRPCGPG